LPKAFFATRGSEQGVVPERAAWVWVSLCAVEVGRARPREVARSFEQTSARVADAFVELALGELREQAFGSLERACDAKAVFHGFEVLGQRPRCKSGVRVSAQRAQEQRLGGRVAAPLFEPRSVEARAFAALAGPCRQLVEQLPSQVETLGAPVGGGRAIERLIAIARIRGGLRCSEENASGSRVVTSGELASAAFECAFVLTAWRATREQEQEQEDELARLVHGAWSAAARCSSAVMNNS
jgi:hypothetical protein